LVPPHVELCALRLPVVDSERGAFPSFAGDAAGFEVHVEIFHQKKKDGNIAALTDSKLIKAISSSRVPSNRSNQQSTEFRSSAPAHGCL
jgi:hypothetical protein